MTSSQPSSGQMGLSGRFNLNYIVIFSAPVPTSVATLLDDLFHGLSIISVGQNEEELKSACVDQVLLLRRGILPHSQS